MQPGRCDALDRQVHLHAPEVAAGGKADSSRDGMAADRYENPRSPSRGSPPKACGHPRATTVVEPIHRRPSAAGGALGSPRHRSIPPPNDCLPVDPSRTHRGPEHDLHGRAENVVHVPALRIDCCASIGVRRGPAGRRCGHGRLQPLIRERPSAPPPPPISAHNAGPRRRVTRPTSVRSDSGIRHNRTGFPPRSASRGAADGAPRSAPRRRPSPRRRARSPR